MEGKDDGMSPGTWGHRLEVGKLWAMGPAMTIYFLMVYGCFQATIAELSSYNRLYVLQSQKYLPVTPYI